MDDVYFLSAAMHCGPGTRLVSSDRFCNLVSRMDPLMKAQFRRWQNLYQMALERFVGDEPVFAVCTCYSCCFIYCMCLCCREANLWRIFSFPSPTPNPLTCQSSSTHISSQIAQKIPFPPRKAQLTPPPPPPPKKRVLSQFLAKSIIFLWFLKTSVTD